MKEAGKEGCMIGNGLREPEHTSVNNAAPRPKTKLKKRVQHRDFPGGHPSQYYSGPSALNCGVLMGSGALTLV